MTNYQTCHIYYGDLTRETAMARELLEKHGKPTPQIVKELRHETDMPMTECAQMLRCTWRDMQLERLQVENQKLREACAELLNMAECHDPEWLHWPEMYEDLRKLGVEVD